MAKISNVNNRQIIDYMARDYESFKKAMIDLIPSKLPEWTDRSEADFGIVLIELFAYMGDILSYYQDRIANESFLATAQERRSIIQHLRLIGYELEPANPTYAELTLEFPNNASGIIHVKKRDRFSTKSTKEKKPVYFEYTLDIPLEINLDALIPDSGKEKGFKRYPSKIVEIKEPLGVSDESAYQKYKLSHVGVVKESINITIGGGKWAKKDTLYYSKEKDNHYTFLFDRGLAKILFGEGIHGKRPDLGKDIEVTYEALLPGIPVKEGKTISNIDHLGYSDGSPNQRFKLSHSPVIKESFKVKVDGTPWNLKDTLIFSEEDSLDYYIQIDENDASTIFFGDGQFGKIPSSGAKIEANYRIGGGKYANVGACEISQIISAEEIPTTAKIYNKRPAVGGEDRETIQHAIKHAPQQFRSRERAVTENDLITLTKRRFKGCKAKAKYSSWNYIDLYFAPAGGGIATSELKREITDYLEDKKMIATIIRVEDPSYVNIKIKGNIDVMANFVNEEIQYKVKETIQDLFKFERLDFEQNLYLSKVYEAIEAMDGVRNVYIERFTREDDLSKNEIAPNGVIEMNRNEIPEIKDIEIIAKGGFKK